MHRHFARWAKKRDIHAYRIYDRDIPQYPFAIDIYEDRLCVSEYINETVTSRKNYETWRASVMQSIEHTLGVSKEKIYSRTRQRQKSGKQYEKNDSDNNHSSDFFEVREGGLKFIVNPGNYLDTGLFLDHRITRSIVRDEVAGKNFLNLFCYTGSFSVYAAAGGANQSISVDTSSVYLNWLRSNMRINNLESSAHVSVRSDARTFLDSYNGKLFDVIFCDPPVFSRGKQLIRDFDVLRDHPDLIEACLKVLSPEGILYFSTNFRKFRIQWTGLCEDISRQTIPDDFSNKQIHVCYKIRK